MKSKTWLFAGLFLLIILEISKVYFIMPLPGSQKNNTIGIAYFLNDNLWWIRLVLIILLVAPLVYLLRSGKTWQKISAGIMVLLYGAVFYAVQFKMLADKMFLQPVVKNFALASADTNLQKLVIGVAINNMSKAYPVEVIGYHHQVRDTLGGEELMVTYCTVCRSGRIFSPIVNGKIETFRLVGMDHFNAMFEDETTKSWWQQATGVSIIGPMKGYQLKEIPSEQMRLGDWMALHPDSKVLVRDTNFTEKYDSLRGYDVGIRSNGVVVRDSVAWNRKSWVVGVTLANSSIAYDWNQLAGKHFIEDQISLTPVLVTMELNKKTHYVLSRELDGKQLHFELDSIIGQLRDKETMSTWLPNGKSIEGPLKDKQLTRIQSYQEYWHSWKQFHPASEAYGEKK